MNTLKPTATNTSGIQATPIWPTNDQIAEQIMTEQGLWRLLRDGERTKKGDQWLSPIRGRGWQDLHEMTTFREGRNFPMRRRLSPNGGNSLAHVEKTKSQFTNVPRDAQNKD